MKRLNKLPNFIVIGAPKSGTTSLFYYLKQHPEIYLPARKELHFFSYEYLKNNRNGPGDHIIIQSLCSSFSDYTMYYSDVINQRCIGEVSPSYLYYAETCRKILATLGKIKIIAILRNPVEKAYSQYMHLVRDNWESLPFYDALMAESERKDRGWSDIWRYAESSLYAKKLQQYIALFGPDNVKVLFFEDLVRNPQNLLQDLFGFLNIDPGIVCDTSNAYNRSGQPRFKFVSNFFARPNIIKSIAKKIIPEQFRIPLRLALLDLNTGKKKPFDGKAAKYLAEYFHDDIDELEKLLGRNVPWR